MIIVLYREDIIAAIEGLTVIGLGADTSTLLHYQHILNVMEKKELQAVAVVEHG